MKNDKNMPMSGRVPAFIIILVIFAAPAFPWGRAGHNAIALIAERRLPPDVQTRIRRLLFDGRYTLRDIAPCADQIRATRTRNNPVESPCSAVAGAITGDTGPWHYIDIPVRTHENDLKKFCPHSDCIVDQIERFSTILSESTDDAARRQALLFLVHFMGDIHQPLHAAERACDRGGNAEIVNFYIGDQQVANIRLHSVWDTDLVNKLMKDSGLDDEASLAADLESRIDEDRAASWARATVRQIAWESYKVARKHVYRGIPFHTFCDKTTPPGKPTDLTSGYESAGSRVVREQLMKAGVRLAALLTAAVSK